MPQVDERGLAEEGADDELPIWGIRRVRGSCARAEEAAETPVQPSGGNEEEVLVAVRAPSAGRAVKGAGSKAKHGKAQRKVRLGDEAVMGEHS